MNYEEEYNSNVVKSSVSFYGKHNISIDYHPEDFFGDESGIEFFALDGTLEGASGIYEGIWSGREDYIDIGDRKVARFLSGGGSIFVSDIERGSEEFTVSGWIYSYGHAGSWVNVWHFTAGGQDCCVNASRTPAIFMYATDNTAFHPKCDTVCGYTNYGTSRTRSAAPYRRWNHIVQTIRGNKMKTYINKVLIDSISAPCDFMLGATNMYINDPWYSENHLVRDVRLFSREVSQEDVDMLYDAEVI